MTESKIADDAKEEELSNATTDEERDAIKARYAEGEAERDARLSTLLGKYKAKYFYDDGIGTENISRMVKSEVRRTQKKEKGSTNSDTHIMKTAHIVYA